VLENTVAGTRCISAPPISGFPALKSRMQLRSGLYTRFIRARRPPKKGAWNEFVALGQARRVETAAAKE